MAKSTLDEKTRKLIDEVKNRSAEIIQLSKARTTQNTNFMFSYEEGKMNDAINLHVESNIKNLIGYAAFLLNKEKSYKEASEYLEIENPPEFTWNGFSVKDWVEDIKTKINKIQINEKKKRLAQLENKLDQIISPELRRQMVLEEVEKELD